LNLQAVDDIPEPPPTYKRLSDQVLEHLAGETLQPGQWYELIHYPDVTGRSGIGSSTGKLTSEPRLAAYKFVARGNIIYVRLKAE
jgi:hypothetical protein